MVMLNIIFTNPFIFSPYIVIDDHGYDGDHINGIKGLTEKGIGVKHSYFFNGPYGHIG